MSALCEAGGKGGWAAAAATTAQGGTTAVPRAAKHASRPGEYNARYVIPNYLEVLVPLRFVRILH